MYLLQKVLQVLNLNLHINTEQIHINKNKYRRKYFSVTLLGNSFMAHP